MRVTLNNNANFPIEKCNKDENLMQKFKIILKYLIKLYDISQCRYILISAKWNTNNTSD